MQDFFVSACSGEFSIWLGSNWEIWYRHSSFNAVLLYHGILSNTVHRAHREDCVWGIDIKLKTIQLQKMWAHLDWEKLRSPWITLHVCELIPMKPKIQFCRAVKVKCALQHMMNLESMAGKVWFQVTLTLNVTLFSKWATNSWQFDSSPTNKNYTPLPQKTTAPLTLSGMMFESKKNAHL